jgi:hypothetical protein
LNDEKRDNAVYKRNLNVQQEKIEALEKERNAENSLRSKLEAEYIQIQKKNEEEITLRLQFESKLN